MKGVILAGGLGTRLHPLTKITNKHLLPIYDKPMIYYPLQAMINAGIEEILIVTGGPYAGDFLKLLGNGSAFGLRDIHYTYQEGEGGIADALRLSEHFSEGEKLAVILGDNLIEGNFRAAADRFREKDEGAMILLKEVPDPERFGVPIFEGDRIVRIEEKPTEPRSNFAVTGIYLYDPRVFEIISTLEPSGRGELEITDVNNAYLDADRLEWEILDGWWTDAGTFDTLRKAQNLVALGGANKTEGPLRGEGVLGG
jgi:glucose-1-phosphate thymidylyltransferase